MRESAEHPRRPGTIGGEATEASIDRVRELASIGAGHAATALGNLLDRPCRMRVPQVRVLPPSALDAPFVMSRSDDQADSLSGVFFEIEGGLGGVLAMLFTPATRTLLVEQLVGKPRREVADAVAESALREFGNILVSHVASAMADTLGVAVIPSIPMLVDEGAPAVLATMVAPRQRDRAAVRIETEISDRMGEIRSVMVFVPDRTTVISSVRAR